MAPPRHHLWLLLLGAYWARGVDGHADPVTLAKRETALYSNIQPVNITDCLHKVLQVPLMYYTFRYDTRSSRPQQVGALGEDLEGHMPEAVEVAASRSFPNPEKGKPPIVLKDIAIVDKNQLFMYNLGATQELLLRQDSLNEMVAQTEQAWSTQTALFDKLRAQLEQDATQEAQEAAKLAELEAERAVLLADFKKTQVEEEQRAIKLQEEQERRFNELMDHEMRERAQREEEMERQRALMAIEAREKAIKEREEARQTREAELKAKELEQAAHLEDARRQAEVDRVKAEARAKAEAERSNEDIALKRIKTKAEEDRKRILETLNVVVERVGGGIMEILSDPGKVLLIIGAFILLAAGYYTVREASKLVRQIVESKIGKPKLVGETSLTLWTSVMEPWHYILSKAALLLPTSRSSSSPSPSPTTRVAREDVIQYFHDVILPRELREQVHMLAISTRNAKANRAPYRHLLLYGPPGTGKTMVAKRLAQCSGMDYAMMSGGDVGPLGKDAVSELHNLFRWAKKSRRGLLLFIDEAEAFLSARGSKQISEERRNALNALLFQTGTQSFTFMMVLATNRPQDLDPAVLDRMDDFLGFGLPNLRDRTMILQLYYKHYLVARNLAGHDSVPELEFQNAAKLLEGFSGREISKLVLSLLNAVYGSATMSMSPQLFDQVVRHKVQEHRDKGKMVVTT